MVDLSYQEFQNGSLKSSDRTVVFQVIKWIAIVAILVGLQLAHASVRDEILTISYQIEKLQQSNAELKATNDALKVEYNTLANPREIETAATRLGLISANNPEVLILEGDRTGTILNKVAQSRSQTNYIHE
jgi:cell division protein FtsL